MNPFSNVSLNLGVTSHTKTLYEQKYAQRNDTNVLYKTYLKPKNPWLQGVNWTEILPNFLVWEFCGKAQFPHSFGQIPRNSAETAFPQNFQTRKLGEISVS